MAFIRLVVPSARTADDPSPPGVITVAYRLLKRDHLGAAERNQLNAGIVWFEKHVPVPDRFNRTTSKGWYRRKTKGLSWLREDATEALRVLQSIADALRATGLEIVELREDRVGYVIHEDELQVIAEPFRDTSIG